MLNSQSTVQAPLEFGKRLSNGEEFYFYQTAELPENVQKRCNVNLEASLVTFSDLRKVPEPFTLLRNGFTLEKMQPPADMQWNDVTQVLPASSMS